MITEQKLEQQNHSYPYTVEAGSHFEAIDLVEQVEGVPLELTYISPPWNIFAGDYKAVALSEQVERDGLWGQVWLGWHKYKGYRVQFG